jgi:hypothetical protein
MLRTIFLTGLFAVLGFMALSFVFKIFMGLVGVLIGLLFVALKIAAVVFVLYLIIRIFAPDTARRMRERWSGSSI